MKRLVLAAGASALLTGAAAAADLPRKSVAPVVAVPMFTWTGFYVGVNAGASFGETKWDHTATGAWIGDPTKPGVDLFGSGSRNVTNFTGGVQLGYNFQFGALVAGLEADIGYFSMKRRTQLGAFVAPGVLNIFTTSSGAGDYLGTIRGRIGVAMDRLLIYATGGLAVSETRFSQQVFFVPTGSAAFGSSSKTQLGYAIGGGAEYAFTNNWTVKAEYLFVDLGKNRTSLFNPTFPAFTHQVESKNRAHIARVGINYKF